MSLAPNRRLGIWPIISLVLTLGVCALSWLLAEQAEREYAEDRARDPLYQANAVLSRELLKAYIIQLVMIDEQRKHPLKPETTY